MFTNKPTKFAKEVAAQQTERDRRLSRYNEAIRLMRNQVDKCVCDCPACMKIQKFVDAEPQDGRKEK